MSCIMFPAVVFSPLKNLSTVPSTPPPIPIHTAVLPGSTPPMPPVTTHIAISFTASPRGFSFPIIATVVVPAPSAAPAKNAATNPPVATVAAATNPTVANAPIAKFTYAFPFSSSCGASCICGYCSFSVPAIFVFFCFVVYFCALGYTTFYYATFSISFYQVQLFFSFYVYYFGF